jgi:hypothetical protein
LLLVLAIYVGLRALLLLSRFDELALPNFELSPMGILAHISSTGWRGIPLSAYYDNCGGHLVVGLLAAPLFKLFGPSYMVLKLVPLGLGLLDLLLIWDISRRLFGERAAIVACLAFSLGPETLVVYSVLAKGNHFEGLTLQWLATWLWVRGFESRVADRWWVAAAFASGAAIFVYLGALLWILLLALTHWLVRGPRRGALELLRAVPPLVLGLSPLAWIELATGRPGHLLESFAGGTRVLERLSTFIADVLPQAAGFSGAGWLSGRFANWTLLLLFCAAWVFTLVIQVARTRADDAPAAGALARLRRFALVPFTAYLPLFVLAFSVTTPRFETDPGPVEVGQFRYLVPHFAFSSVLFGALAGWALEQASPRRRTLGTLLAIGPLAIAAPFLLARVDWSFSNFAEGSVYRGYDLADLAPFLLREGSRDPQTARIDWDLGRLVAELEEYHESERGRIAYGLGREQATAQTFEQRILEGELLDFERILAPLPEALRFEAARGVGAGLVQHAAYRRTLKRTLRELERTHPDHVNYVAEGLSSPIRGSLGITTARALQRTHDLGDRIPPGLRDSWRRGQGLLCGELLGRGLEDDKERMRVFVRWLAEEGAVGQEAFWAGAEEAFHRSHGGREVFAALREDLERVYGVEAPTSEAGTGAQEP